SRGLGSASHVPRAAKRRAVRGGATAALGEPRPSLQCGLDAAARPGHGSGMHKLKLTYFDMHGGRGEVARIALSIGGVAFEDRRVKFADWPALKPSTPFGAIPVL